MAHGFAANGAKVFITGRRAEVLASAAAEINAGTPGSVLPIQGDGSTKAGCAAVASAIAAQTDRVDVLINNAGILRDFRAPADPRDRESWLSPLTPAEAVAAQLASVDDADFAATHATNVAGVFFATTALLPLLRASPSPSVIVLGSCAAAMATRAGDSPVYNASKAATVHLARNLAARLAPLGIRVNTINPGIFPSEMSVLEAGAGRSASRSPAGRAGRYEEIVGPAILLASAGGGYMFGSSVDVDGGRSWAAGAEDGIQLRPAQYAWPL